MFILQISQSENKSLVYRPEVFIHRNLLGEERFKRYLEAKYPDFDIVHYNNRRRSRHQPPNIDDLFESPSLKLAEATSSSSVVPSSIDDLFSSLNGGPADDESMTSLDDLLMSVKAEAKPSSTDFAGLFSSLESIDNDTGNEPQLAVEPELGVDDLLSGSVHADETDSGPKLDDDDDDVAQPASDDYDMDLYGDLGIDDALAPEETMDVEATDADDIISATEAADVLMNDIQERKDEGSNGLDSASRIEKYLKDRTFQPQRAVAYPYQVWLSFNNIELLLY
jgi:hypothetical protein